MNSTHGPGGAFAGAGVLKAALALKATKLAVLIGPVGRLADRPALAALWVATAAAGALLPDSDHPSSTTARMWGPLTRVPCALVNRVSGGHRHATHDVSKGAPLFFALAAAAGWVGGRAIPPLAAVSADWVTGTYQGRPAAAAALALLAFAAAARLATVAIVLGLAFLALAAWLPGRWEHRPAANLTAAWGGAWALDHEHLITGQTSLLLAVALAGGVLIGGIGLDACTPEGVPWRRRYVHLLPTWLRIPTNSRREALLRLGLWVAVPALIAWTYGPASLVELQAWLQDPTIPVDVATWWPDRAT